VERKVKNALGTKEMLWEEKKRYMKKTERYGRRGEEEGGEM
jgi:hypothetical protein